MNKRLIFTSSHFDGYSPWKKGPMFHAGRFVRVRPIWFDDYGAARLGRTGDMIQMLDDLGIKDRSF